MILILNFAAICTIEEHGAHKGFTGRRFLCPASGFTIEANGAGARYFSSTVEPEAVNLLDPMCFLKSNLLHLRALIAQGMALFSAVITLEAI